MANPIEQEIILQPDGNFYKRTVVTTLIKSQADAVQRVKSKPVFTVVDIPVAPKTNIALWTGGDSSEKRYLFREADFFPLRGAVLTNQEEFCSLTINSAPYQRLEDAGQIQTREFNDGNGLRWHPSVLGFKLYYMFTYQYNTGRDNTFVSSYGAPYVFLYHPTLKTSFVPNLPNVYDSGQICTGDNYTDVETTVHKLLAANEFELNNSNCNNDLRSSPHYESNFIRFDENGNTVAIASQNMPQISETTGEVEPNYFFNRVTLEPILEYTKWLNNTKH